MGGFVAFVMVVTYALVSVWNLTFLDSFLVSSVFKKKLTGHDITKINLNWTSLIRAWNKPDFLTRAKGLKRVDT